MKPIELLTRGFYNLKELPSGLDGRALLSYNPETTWGQLSMLLSAAAPEFIYTTVGMGLVRSGLNDWNKKPIAGMFKTSMGGICMSNTFYYMKTAFWGGKPGHDYYNVTQHGLETLGLPGDWATVFTPPIRIPALFATTYFIAGIFTSKRKDRTHFLELVVFHKKNIVPKCKDLVRKTQKKNNNKSSLSKKNHPK